MSNDTSQDPGQAPPQSSKSVSQYPPNTDTPPSSFNQMPSSGTNPGTHLKYYAAAGILVVVIVALLIFFVRSNPTASPSTPPTILTKNVTVKALYTSTMEKLNSTKDLMINYSIEIPLLSQSYLAGTLANMSLSFFKVGNDTKALINIQNYGAVAAYDINGSSFICTESSLSSYPSCSSTSTQQSLYQTPEPQNSTKLLGSMLNLINNDTKVTYSGPSTIAGRACSEYVMNINASEVNGLIGEIDNSTYGSTYSSYYYSISSLLPAGSSLTLEMCLDNQYGYPASLNLSYNKYSTLTGKNTTTKVITLQSTGFSTNVGSSEFTIPVSFMIQNLSLECTPNSIQFGFTSLRNSANTTILINNITSIYGISAPIPSIITHANANSLVFGHNYSVSATPSENLSGSYYTPDVCIDGSCQTEDCFVQYYYNYNYTTGGYTSYSHPVDYIAFNGTNIAMKGSTGMVDPNGYTSYATNITTYNPSDKSLYLLDPNTGYVAIINGNSSSAQYVGSPSSVVYDPADTYVYMLSSSGYIYVMSGSSIIATIYPSSSSGSLFGSMVYNPSNHYLYALIGSEAIVINGTKTIGTINYDSDKNSLSQGSYLNAVYNNASNDIYVAIENVSQEYSGGSYQYVYNYSIVVINGMNVIGTIKNLYASQLITTPSSELFAVGSRYNYTTNEYLPSAYMLDGLNATALPLNASGYVYTSAYDPANNQFYVSTSYDLYSFNGTTLASQNPLEATYLTYDPVTKDLYALGYQSAEINSTGGINYISLSSGSAPPLVDLKTGDLYSYSDNTYTNYGGASENIVYKNTVTTASLQNVYNYAGSAYNPSNGYMYVFYYANQSS